MDAGCGLGALAGLRKLEGPGGQPLRRRAARPLSEAGPKEALIPRPPPAPRGAYLPCSVGGATSRSPGACCKLGRVPTPALQGRLAEALLPPGLFPYLQGALGGAVSFSLTWVEPGGAGATG